MCFVLCILRCGACLWSGSGYILVTDDGDWEDNVECENCGHRTANVETWDTE